MTSARHHDHRQRRRHRWWYGPPWRGPAWRLSIVVGVIQVGGTLGAYHDHRGEVVVNSLDALGIALLVLGPVALAFRRRYPVPVLMATFAITAIYNVLDYHQGPIYLSLVAAFIAASVFGFRTIAIATLVAGYFVFLWLGYLLGTDDAPSLGEAFAAAAWLIGIIAVSEMLITRRQRAIEASRTRREEAKRRASEERLRIAQELHDVLAHNISLINVQSGVALHLIEDKPEQARTALAAIKDASDDALRELRSVLEILRETDRHAPRSPTPRLSDVGDLVNRSRAAGLNVEMNIGGEPKPLPPRVDRAAFRIIQEALTNAVRHARPRRTWVRISYRQDELVIEVEDDGLGVAAPPSTHGGGSGIPGMRERAIALGGEFEAGPLSAGGFRVRARLPLVDEPRVHA